MIFTCAKAEVMRPGRLVYHADCVQPHAKRYVWIYMKFLPNVGLGPVSTYFHFGGDPD